ncbi:MAG: RNA-binding S4 domain-containing protein [Betaproteobacteria bacterium]
MNDNARGVRIDKWLWAARFFKTRSLAQTAVSGGKVRLKDERVKVAKEVKVGDTLSVRIGEYEWGVVVTALSEKRGSAEIARTLYEETADSIAKRLAQIAERRAEVSVWGERKGRPTKRERREVEKWQRGD